MNEDTRELGKVIKIDESRIKEHLDEMVRGSVEDTLNSLLDAEVDQTYNSQLDIDVIINREEEGFIA